MIRQYAYVFFLLNVCFLGSLISTSAQETREDSLLAKLAQVEGLGESNNTNKARIELGIHYQKTGKFGSAEKAFLHVLSDSNQLERQVLADLYSHIGLNHYYQGNYSAASGFHLKNLALSEKTSYPLGLIKATNGLGIIALRTGKLEEAEDFFTQSLDKSEEIGNSERAAYSLGNLALVYGRKAAFEKALEMRKKALALFTESGNQLQIARSLNNLGVGFVALSKFDSAGYYYQAALDTYRDLKDMHGISQSLPNVAFILRKQGKYEEAKKYMFEALAYADSTGSKESKQLIWKALADMYREWGRYEAALNSQLWYNLYKDSVISEKHLQDIEELQVKYETEKKQQELKQLAQENYIQSETIAKKDFWLILLLIAAVLMAGLGILIWRISKQRIEFAKKEARFEAVIQTEENERKRIAQNLHDSIGGMLSVVKTQLSEFVLEDGKLDYVVPLVSDACEEVRRISHDLSPKILEEYGLQAATQNLVDHLHWSKKIDIHFYPFALEKPITPLVEVLVYRIIQELLQNILKHAQASKIEIHLTRHPDSLNLVVEDNGVGLQNGPDIETAGGMGLTNIQERVLQLKGNMQVDSKKGEGLSVLIDIPI